MANKVDKQMIDNINDMPVIAAFIIVKNPMNINKDDIISVLDTISYDDIEYQCIKCEDDSFLVGFSISGFNKLPGSDLATIDMINSVKYTNDSSYNVLSKIGNDIQRIYIMRGMV